MESASGQANRELVASAFSAAQGMDAEAFLGLLHPEVEVHEPDYLPYGGLYKGRESFAGIFVEAAKLLDFSTLNLIGASVDGDHCVLLMTVRLATNGEERYLSEHWDVQDGLIRRIRIFWSGLP